MQILHNVPKPLCPTEWETPLIVHGDFNGVKIFSFVGDLGDDYRGQVLLSNLSPSELILTHDYSGKVTGATCCFIG